MNAVKRKEEVNEEDETPGRKQRTEQKLKRKGATQGAEGKTKWKGRVTSEMLLMPVFSLKSSAQFVLLFLSCQLVHFVASVLSLQLFPSIRYFLPFVSTPFNPVRYFFPFVSTLSFCSLYVVPFVLNSSSVCYFPPILSTRPPCSFTSSFHFKAFISLRYFLIFLPFVSIPFVYLFVSFQVVHFVTSFLSLQLFFPARLALRFLPTRPFHCIRPFVATLPFHSLLPSFRFNSFSSRSLLLPFRFNSALLFPIRRFFCFKLFSSVRYFLPIVLMLPSSSCTASFHFKAFISLLPYLLPSFLLLHAVRLPLPFVSCRSYRYLLRFASALLSCPSCFSFPFNSSISLHPSFRCNLSLPFVTSFLSFQTSLPFVCLFLSFQVVHFITSFLSF